MLYVIRDGNGSITSVFRWPNPDATEALREDDPEVVAFRNAQRIIPSVEARIQADPLLRRIVAAVAKAMGKTPQEFLASIQGEP